MSSPSATQSDKCNKMQIFVNTAIRRTIPLEVECSETVQSLEAKLSEASGSPTQPQHLTFLSKQLSKHHTLAYYDIRDQSVLHCNFVSGTMPVNIQCKGAKVFTMTVSDKIKDVKKQIQTREGIPLEKQKVVLSGLYLSDESTLLDPLIKEESLLRLHIANFIHVLSPTEKTVATLSAREIDMITSLKRKIQEETGIPLVEQHLYFNGVELKDECTVGAYNLRGECIILDPYPDNSMKIYVRKPRKTTFTVSVQPDDTIGKTKAKIQILQRVPSEKQTLKFEGKELNNGSTISDYNIRARSTVDLHYGFLHKEENAVHPQQHAGVEKTKRRMSKLSENYDKVSQEMESHKAALEECSDKIRLLQDSSTGISKRESRYVQMKDECQSQYSKLEEQLLSVTWQLKEKEEMIQRYSKIAEHREEIAVDHRERIKELKDEKQRIMQELGIKKREIQEYEEVIANLNEEKAAFSLRVDQCMNEKEEFRARADRLQQQLQLEKNQMQGEMDKLKEQLSQQDKAELQQQLASIEIKNTSGLIEALKPIQEQGTGGNGDGNAAALVPCEEDGVSMGSKRLLKDLRLENSHDNERMRKESTEHNDITPADDKKLFLQSVEVPRDNFKIKQLHSIQDTFVVKRKEYNREICDYSTQVDELRRSLESHKRKESELKELHDQCREACEQLEGRLAMANEGLEGQAAEIHVDDVIHPRKAVARSETSSKKEKLDIGHEMTSQLNAKKRELEILDEQISEQGDHQQEFENKLEEISKLRETKRDAVEELHQRTECVEQMRREAEAQFQEKHSAEYLNEEDNGEMEYQVLLEELLTFRLSLERQEDELRKYKGIVTEQGEKLESLNEMRERNEMLEERNKTLQRHHEREADKWRLKQEELSNQVRELGAEVEGLRLRNDELSFHVTAHTKQKETIKRKVVELERLVRRDVQEFGVTHGEDGTNGVAGRNERLVEYQNNFLNNNFIKSICFVVCLYGLVMFMGYCWDYLV